MLKRNRQIVSKEAVAQPPSGGCVLKLIVPTVWKSEHNQPPSGGCVLKLADVSDKQRRPYQPPSGGCVLKRWVYITSGFYFSTSRLQAAVC